MPSTSPPAASRRRGQGDDSHDDDYAIDAPGADEVAVLPWPLLLRRRLARRVEASDHFARVVLVTTLFGLFTVGFTITILAVSLPTIAEDLGSSTTTLTWVITGPLLAFGIVGPAFGKAGDLWGQKRAYLAGMAGVAVFAVGIALSWNAGSLIAFRVLGAAAGAACGPASMALIYSVFPRERRVQAMGYWSLVMAGGPVLGVVAGGPIVEQLGWRWIFVAQAPLTVVGFVVAALLLPETERSADRSRFDVVGAVSLALGVTGLLLGLNRGPEWGWDAPAVIVAFALAPTGLALFVWWERRTAHPLIRLEYFRRANFAFPIATQFFTNFAYMGGFIVTPLFLAEVFDYGPSRIGLLSIARPLAYAVVAPVGGYLAVRMGERPAGVFGAVAVAASMVALAQLEPGMTDAVVIGALALSGIGLGASSPSMAATVANAVDSDSLGVAGAAQQLVTQVGVVAGIQLMQTLQVTREAGVGELGAYHEAYLLGAVVCVLGVVTAFFVRSSPRGDDDEVLDLTAPAPQPATAGRAGPAR